MGFKVFWLAAFIALCAGEAATVGVHETGRVRGSEPSGRAGESSTAAQRLREEQGARPCVGRGR